MQLTFVSCITGDSEHESGLYLCGTKNKLLRNLVQRYFFASLWSTPPSVRQAYVIRSSNLEADVGEGMGQKDFVSRAETMRSSTYKTPLTVVVSWQQAETVPHP